MGLMPARAHIVKPGESLSTIAKTYNLRSWKLLYYAAVNEPLRQRRPDPNRISVGDTVMIPPPLRDTLQARLEELQKIKALSEKSFAEQRQYLDREFRGVANTFAAVDAAAIVLNAVGGLVQVARSAHGALKLSGEALAAANAKLAQSTLMSRGGITLPLQLGSPGLQDLVGTAVTGIGGELTGNEGLAWAVTKIVVGSAMDALSPSFWARAWSEKTLNPQSAAAIHQSAISALEQARQQVLRPLEDKLMKTRILLGDYESKMEQFFRTA